MIAFSMWLHTNADFVTFKKLCKENFDSSNANGTLCILKAELNNLLGATYIACCRNFVEFQIDKFKASPDMFPLATMACNHAERHHGYDNVDFDYGVDHLEPYYKNDTDDSCNSKDSEFDYADESAFRRTHALNCSIYVILI